MKFDLRTIFKQVSQWDIRVRYGIFGLCVLLAAGLDYAVLVRWQLRGLDQMAEQIKTMTAEVEHVKSDMQRIVQIKSGVEGMRSQLEMVNSKIRSIQEVPDVLGDISRMANEAEVTIDQLTPSKEGQQKLLSVGAIEYYMLPIVIIGRSGYHMFGRFLNKLESADLLFVVNALEIEGKDKDPGKVAIRITINVIFANRSAEMKK